MPARPPSPRASPATPRMEPRERIAAIGALDERVLTELRALPTQPEARAFRSLADDGGALLRFAPAIAVVAPGTEAAEDVGALRLLRQLWPALGLVLVGPAATEAATAGLARRLGAQALAWPAAPGALAAAIEHARHGSDRPRFEAFAELARGVADEVNNPLLFVAGHLQLLQACLGAEHGDAHAQVAAALAGTGRIAASVDRLQALAQATGGPRQPEAVDLAELLARALATRPRAADNARASAPAATGADFVVRGDRVQLAAAVGALLQFADDLVAAEATAALDLAALPGACRMRLCAHGGLLAHWQLPRSFEPYAPTRALRGQNPGLGLALVQAVVLGHAGEAQARRLADGGLQFDFVLPRARADGA
jgi:signal transduction histidine kinase